MMEVLDSIYTKSIYVQEQIELSIATGKLVEGEKLYSLSEMCGLFEIGKTTAMKIVKQLEDDNIIYKKRGLGYFIKPFAEEILKEKYHKLVNEKLQKVKEVADLLEINLVDELKKMK